MPKVASVLIALACAAAAGCGERTEIKLHIDDPNEDAPRTVVLEHAALARIDPVALPGVTLPGQYLVFVGESPDVCSTLSMGFVRGEEFFARLHLPDEPAGALGITVSGPDGGCDAWAETSGEHSSSVDGDRLTMDLAATGLVADDNGPARGTKITIEGVIDAELCPGVFDGTSPVCGVPQDES